MVHKKLFSIVIAFILIIFVSLIFWFNSNQEKSLLLCEKLNGDFNRSNCYYNLAIKEKNIEVCRKVGNASLTVLANRSRIQYGIYPDACYLDVATIKKDPALCDRIGSGFLRSECLIRLAKDLKNSDLCEKITESSDYLSKVHKYRCYASVATEKSDYSICDKLPDIDTIEYETKETCYGQIAANKGEIEVCRKLNSFVQYFCYIQIGIAQKNHSICNYLNTSYGVDGCYLSIALAINDTFICNVIRDFSLKAKCVAKVSLALGNILCDILPSQNEKDLCYHHVAVDSGNNSFCISIQNSTRREKCLSKT